MLRAIAIWILGWLETSLDPELGARVKALKDRAAELEAERTRLMAEVAVRQKEIDGLNLTLSEDLAKRNELETAIQRSKDETAKKLAELDSLSEHDRVRVDL